MQTLRSWKTKTLSGKKRTCNSSSQRKTPGTTTSGSTRTSSSPSEAKQRRSERSSVSRRTLWSSPGQTSRTGSPSRCRGSNGAQHRTTSSSGPAGSFHGASTTASPSAVARPQSSGQHPHSNTQTQEVRHKRETLSTGAKHGAALGPSTSKRR